MSALLTDDQYVEIVFSIISDLVMFILIKDKNNLVSLVSKLIMRSLIKKFALNTYISYKEKYNLKDKVFNTKFISYIKRYIYIILTAIFITMYYLSKNKKNRKNINYFIIIIFIFFVIGAYLMFDKMFIIPKKILEQGIKNYHI